MTVDNTTIDLLTKLLQQLNTIHVNNTNVANNCPSPPVAFATGTSGFVGPNNGLVDPIGFSHSVPNGGPTTTYYNVGPTATYPMQQAQPQQAHTSVLHQQPTQARRPLPAQYTTPANQFGYPVVGHSNRLYPSIRDLYPVTAPSLIPHAFHVSQHKWHQRLGHPGGEVLCRIVSFNFISYNKEKSPVLCHACQLDKHARLPFVSSITVISSYFDIIHSDVWTSPIPILLGFKHDVLFLDHYSQFVWVYLLVNKYDVMSKFVLFCNYVRTQFKCEIKSFQCDHGGEFDNRLLHTLLPKMEFNFAFHVSKPLSIMESLNECLWSLSNDSSSRLMTHPLIDHLTHLLNLTTDMHNRSNTSNLFEDSRCCDVKLFVDDYDVDRVYEDQNVKSKEEGESGQITKDVAYAKSVGDDLVAVL
nr:ribonuclease H-like domain-containing protein [Tanacetum cinerariifolium]